MPKVSRTGWKTDAGLLFAVLIWGVNFPILKAALSAMHPFVVNAFRFTVSAAVLGTVYAVRKRAGVGPSFGETVRGFWKELVGLGLLGYLFYQLSFITGIDHTLASNAALIMASSPLWTAAFGHVFGLERIRRAAWLGLAVCLAGTAVVVIGGSHAVQFGSRTLLGNTLMLLAAAMWGAYTAFSRPVLRRLQPSSVSFLALMVALPFLYLLAVPYWGQVKWPQVDGWVWLAIIFSGGLSTGLTYVIWNSAVQAVGASQTAAFNNLVPFVGVLASFLILGEDIYWPQIVGGALIIGGLVITRGVREREEGGKRESVEEQVSG
ncbi:MAG TPA: DMT family transporter [Rhodothermales bacterium]|nr:DMT family transporter [Rhodothermales bacterium]